MDNRQGHRVTYLDYGTSVHVRLYIPRIEAQRMNERQWSARLAIAARGEIPGKLTRVSGGGGWDHDHEYRTAIYARG